MAFLVLGVGALNLTQGRVDLATIWLAAMLYLSVLAIPLFFYRATWGWFHPVVFLPVSTLVLSVLPSVVVYIGGLESHSALPGRAVEDLNHLVVSALLLQTLGFIMFYVGFASTGQMPTGNIRLDRPRAILPKVAAIAAVSLLGFVVLIQAAGGLDPLLLQRGIGADRRVGAELGGQWSFLARHALPMACLVWLGLRPIVVRKPIYWAFFGGGLFVAFAATGARSSVVMPILMALSIWMMRTGRVPYVRTMVLGIVIITGVGIGTEFRLATRQQSTVQDVRIETGAASSFMRGLETKIAGEAESSALVAILGRVPEEVDLLYGRSYLSIPAAPIPSRIWPDKPQAGGRMAGYLIFGRQEGGGGHPPGTVGEAFWNFHILGVMIVYFLWGVIGNWSAQFYLRHGGHGGITALYVIHLFSFHPNSVSFYGWFHGVASAMIALILFCRWPRFRRTLARGDEVASVAEETSVPPLKSLDTEPPS